MAYRLHGERVALTIDGLDIEVQPVSSDTVYRTIVALGSTFVAEPTTEALSALVSYFCLEAQPTFEVIDHRGVVPATPAGMLRLPDALVVRLALEWAEAFVAEPPASAVDKMVPPGEMRDELNRRLRAVA